MTNATLPAPDAEALFESIPALDLAVESAYTDVSVRPKATARNGVVAYYEFTVTRGDGTTMTLDLDRSEVFELSRTLLAVL